MHLDSLLVFVEGSFMFKLIPDEVTIEFAVDPFQHLQGKLSCYTFANGVGINQNFPIFDEVDS